MAHPRPTPDAEDKVTDAADNGATATAKVRLER